MRVIFLEHVINVGKKGEIKEVKSWYAANFLFPKKLAKEFTQADEKKLADKENKIEENRVNLLANKSDIAKELSKKTFSFHMPHAASGKIHGSLKEKHIVEEIKKQFKIQLTKKNIRFENGHIKQIGDHTIYVDFGDKVSAKVNITIF